MLSYSSFQLCMLSERRPQGIGGATAEWHVDTTSETTRFLSQQCHECSCEESWMGCLAFSTQLEMVATHQLCANIYLQFGMIKSASPWFEFVQTIPSILQYWIQNLNMKGRWRIIEASTVFPVAAFLDRVFAGLIMCCNAVLLQPIYFSLMSGGAGSNSPFSPAKFSVVSQSALAQSQLQPVSVIV